MNWINNFVRPKIRSLIIKQDVPDNLWEKCPSCGQMIFHRELASNQRVCTNCGHHLRISVDERLKLLFDDGKHFQIEMGEVISDPLKFKDREAYTDRLKKSRRKTNRKDAIVVAEGTIGGEKAVVAAFDFSFMGGSMGIAVGEGLVTAAKRAVETKAALIAIPASGGARMQEGILSLMQMPRSVIAVEMVKDAGLPYIVLLTDPTTGGVSASFAMLGDVQIAEPGAIIGFAGQRVIEETIRESLPDGFQRSEYLLEHGMVDVVVPRTQLSEKIGALLSLLMPRDGAPKPKGGKKPDKASKPDEMADDKAGDETGKQAAGKDDDAGKDAAAGRPKPDKQASSAKKDAAA